ncbi:helix-turn-helix domain-containing protein [Desulfosporosinus sp. OT]|uniref:TrmB family transcriptional regulator n=1 Tax=Desulfosporosinus sp. OT TaxID=913865 RepID=UPI000223AF92|nr:helix-turn-helix domain-containing protein [Desulfosporosinus sp. OT]EGW36812.1 sugar-specific transcriptional regulator TrmB family protein [Desulfosporosinus sp. OT]
MVRDLSEILQRFGFTQYESKAYQALVRSGPSNASSISKVSGIPRARIYDTLESLVEQGIVMTEENAEGVKTYTCLPVSVFLERIRNSWLTDFSFAEKELKAIENQGEKQDTYISTLRGKDNILAFCRILIRRAKNQIILSVWDTMYNELLPDLQQAVHNGRRLRGITFEVFQPLEGLYSHRLNDYMSSLRSENWFILSIDSCELLYGHSAERDSNAFYTDDSVHIYLLEDYIWHDVLVNRLIKEQGKQLDNWILPEMEEFFDRKLLPPSF